MGHRVNPTFLRLGKTIDWSYQLRDPLLMNVFIYRLCRSIVFQYSAPYTSFNQKRNTNITHKKDKYKPFIKRRRQDAKGEQRQRTLILNIKKRILPNPFRKASFLFSHLNISQNPSLYICIFLLDTAAEQKRIKQRIKEKSFYYLSGKNYRKGHRWYNRIRKYQFIVSLYKRKKRKKLKKLKPWFFKRFRRFINTKVRRRRIRTFIRRAPQFKKKLTSRKRQSKKTQRRGRKVRTSTRQAKNTTMYRRQKPLRNNKRQRRYFFRRVNSGLKKYLKTRKRRPLAIKKKKNKRKNSIIMIKKRKRKKKYRLSFPRFSMRKNKESKRKTHKHRRYSRIKNKIKRRRKRSRFSLLRLTQRKQLKGSSYIGKTKKEQRKRKQLTIRQRRVLQFLRLTNRPRLRKKRQKKKKRRRWHERNKSKKKTLKKLHRRRRKKRRNFWVRRSGRSQKPKKRQKKRTIVPRNKKIGGKNGRVRNRRRIGFMNKYSRSKKRHILSSRKFTKKVLKTIKKEEEDSVKYQELFQKFIPKWAIGGTKENAERWARIKRDKKRQKKMYKKITAPTIFTIKNKTLLNLFSRREKKVKYKGEKGTYYHLRQISRKRRRGIKKLRSRKNQRILIKKRSPLFLINLVRFLKIKTKGKKIKRTLNLLKFLLRYYKMIKNIHSKKRLFLLQLLATSISTTISMIPRRRVTNRLYLFLHMISLFLYTFRYKHLKYNKRLYQSRFLRFNLLSKLIIFSLHKVAFLTSKDQITLRFYGLHNRNFNAQLLLNFMLIRLEQYFKLYQILNPLLNRLKTLSSLKGYRLIISGRLTRKERAAFIVKSAVKMPLSSYDSKIDSAADFKIMKFGVVGIKIHLLYEKTPPYFYFFEFKNKIQT